MANYSYVVDSSFQPFSLQEMLIPFMAYKDAYEKKETQLDELATKANVFEDLSRSLPKDDAARVIYDNYANELRRQGIDLATNGLTMTNGMALSNLKRRYTGEIGALERADKEVKKELAIRQSRATQDPTVLYATSEPTISSYLNGRRPNEYSISGNQLYSMAAQEGKNLSERRFSAGDGSTALGGYYINYLQKRGISQDELNNISEETRRAIANDFKAEAMKYPEYVEAAESILKRTGAWDNLSGNAKQQAIEQVVSGLTDGSIYQETTSLQRNYNALTPTEQLSIAKAGYKRDANGNIVVDENNPITQIANMQLQEEKAKFNSIFMEDPNNPGNYTYRPEVLSNLAINPITGKPTTKTETDTPTPDQVNKAANDLSKSLLALKKKDFGEDGFDVTANDAKGTPQRYHYKYKGAIAYVHKPDGEGNPRYTSGLIGDDHEEGRGWGFTSTTNVASAGGNYSGAYASSVDSRILSEDEIIQLNETNPNWHSNYLNVLSKMFNVKASNETLDDIFGRIGANAEVIEVPNESGNQKGYLIAMTDEEENRVRNIIEGAIENGKLNIDKIQ